MSARKTLLPETASQTAGPYVHIGLMPHAAGIDDAPPAFGTQMVAPEVAGSRILLFGYIYDGQGAVVRDAVIEVTQRDPEGRRAGAEGTDPGFLGWARVATDFQTGKWQIETVAPGTDGTEAAHFAFWIVARGINIGLHTRAYVPDAPAYLAKCPVLQSVPPERQDTLIADLTHDGYRFDIHLQGAQETVFFDV